MKTARTAVVAAKEIFPINAHACLLWNASNRFNHGTDYLYKYVQITSSVVSPIFFRSCSLHPYSLYPLHAIAPTTAVDKATLRISLLTRAILIGFLTDNECRSNCNCILRLKWRISASAR